MRRREFLGVLGGAVVWPLAVPAQQAAKVPLIGYLGASTPSAQSDWFRAFAQRLREHGWIDGRTVTIDVRWAQNRAERYAEIAAEFVRRKVDVIVTLGIAVPAAKRATLSIPIVFAVDADPVGSGLVASLARPGGTSQGYRLSRRTSPANGSNCCARLCLVCDELQRWAMPIGMAPLRN